MAVEQSPVFSPQWPTLHCSQLRALMAFRRGKSVAILGSAGSGKSYILSLIIEEAKRLHGYSGAVSVCAMTNQAALHLGGSTIHSLLGAPPSWEFSDEGLLSLVQKNPNRVKRLQAIEVIVIDEAPLLQAGTFDALDYVMRSLASSDRLSSVPFGGRQVVLAGDPFQLEPVGMKEDQVNTHHAFFSRSWSLMFGGYGSGIVSILGGNHRQRSDEKFYSILNRIRIGRETSEDIASINNTSMSVNSPPKSCTVLCLKKKQVDDVNEKALSFIEAPMFSFHARDTYIQDRTEELTARIGQVAPKLVQVKLGCHLLLTRTVSGLPPGTRVIVKEVCRSGTSPDSLLVKVHGDSTSSDLVHVRPLKFHIHSSDASVSAYRTQIPVISAYAITIHRSQGLTLASVAVDFSEIGNWRPKGMVYVALSRCTSLRGLWIRGLRKDHIKVSHNACQLMMKVSTLYKHFPARVIGMHSIPNEFICRKRPTSFLQDTGATNSRFLRRRVQ